MLREVIGIGGYVYKFTERECEIIEKYFDSIRLFMDDEIVDNIISDIAYDYCQYDVITLVAYYDEYLCENNYDEEQEFSQIMFNEFGVDI